MSTTTTTVISPPQAQPQSKTQHTLPIPDYIPPVEDSPIFQALARGDQHGKVKLKGIPTFTDAYAKRQWVREHMAAAFRFFGKQGYGEGASGHISVRDTVLPGHFWMNPFAKHFSLMKASDLVLVNEEGYVVEGGNQAVINEAGFMIHSEVHRARPEVMAVAHTHGVYGKTWSAFGKEIEMITQDACNFYGKLAVYEEHGGIALSKDEGRAIAKSLGKENSACILQNHGLITVGSTVDEAAWLFYSLDKACHSQLMAEAAAANGVPKKIIPDDVAKYNGVSIQDPHNFYLEFQPEYELVVAESRGEVLL